MLESDRVLVETKFEDAKTHYLKGILESSRIV